MLRSFLRRISTRWLEDKMQETTYNLANIWSKIEKVITLTKYKNAGLLNVILQNKIEVEYEQTILWF